MNFIKPNHSASTLILMGLLAFAFPVIAVCSALCPSDTPGAIFFQHATCSISVYSFFLVGGGLAGLFILSLIGLFISDKMYVIPAGYIFPMLKPPRLSS
jgi:hypothetical protein